VTETSFQLWESVEPLVIRGSRAFGVDRSWEKIAFRPEAKEVEYSATDRAGYFMKARTAR